MILRVNHIGLSVRNLDRSLEFYRDVLGMEQVSLGTFGGDEQYDAILGLQRAMGRVAAVKLDTLKIELFEFTHPPPKHNDRTPSVCDHGITHFCIEVVNIDHEFERLRRAGVTFHCPPLTFFGRARATYARDPDGNVIELLESIDVDS